MMASQHGYCIVEGISFPMECIILLNSAFLEYSCLWFAGLLCISVLPVKINWFASGGPSQGQEIDGKAGANPARYRHCDVGWILKDPTDQPDCQPDGICSTVRGLRTLDAHT